MAKCNFFGCACGFGGRGEGMWVSGCKVAVALEAEQWLTGHHALAMYLAAMMNGEKIEL